MHTTNISVDLAHYEIFRAKVGKDDIYKVGKGCINTYTTL